MMQKIKELLSSKWFTWFILVGGAMALIYYYGKRIPYINGVWELVDEYGYLVNAAYMSGTEWEYMTNSYYGYGYSILLIPLFWLCNTGIEIIRGAIWINVICVVALFFVQYLLLSKLVKDINKNSETLHDVVHFKGVSEGIEIEGAFQYTNEFHENILGFCNNIFNAEGGAHITGFKTVFTTVINNYARELGILKEKDTNFTGADVRNGMTAVISIKHPDPRFEGQTKTKLDNQDASRATAKVTGDEIQLFFDKNLEVLKTVISCAEKAAKIRKSEEKAKTNLLTKQKFSFDSNGKLANCESRDPSICEIFIVEGDSAGGSAKTARDRNFQAILPIRGKILNVEKASIDKVLANAEIKTMINAFGCGFSEGYGNDFDISKLRYDKIIIMADADVDGAHISTLLLTLFYRFMPELIYEGHVYVAMPPLYKAIPSKGEEEYLYDDAALERYRKTHKGSFTLQRYKGLGEMDAEQLWETTLDPERRMLRRIEIEDGRMASDITELLMGNDVPPRRAFIYEHAHDAALDV